MSLNWPADCVTVREKLEWLHCAAERLRLAHNAAKTDAARAHCLARQTIVLGLAAKIQKRLGLAAEDKADQVLALKRAARTAPRWVADVESIDPVADRAAVRDG
jgi:hypothetical protein